MIGRWKKEYSTGKFFENANNTDIASVKIRMAELERLVGELLFKNKMLKKAKELDTIQKKRRFIDNNKFKRKTVQEWCKIMGISKSAYYYKPKDRSKFNLYLADRINEIATEFPSYGYRRITA